MPIYTIVYDLKQEPPEVYNGLIKALENSADICHAQESVWLICTSWTAEQLYNHFAKHLKRQDQLLVLQLAMIEPNSHWCTVGSAGYNWIARHFPRPGAAT